MKIDLSKYPPGTKFKLKNGETVVLVGKSKISPDYLIEHIRDKYYMPDCPAVTYIHQNGTTAATTDKYDIESVIQPDKYLVSFCRKDNTLDTEIITEPQVLTAEHFLTNLQNRFTLGALGDSIPVKVLSWSKIEE
jgi:hypothetical protein